MMQTNKLNKTSLAICEKRLGIINCDEHCLVVGGPGSGKTTLALLKAQKAITNLLYPTQSVLFLSFSRAAIARLMDATGAIINREHRASLSMHTFHSFFWGIVQSHLYLLGSPRKVSILLPHDERVLSGNVKEGELLWNEWMSERKRLARQDGRVAFDLFAPLVRELLQRIPHLTTLIASRHPLIIVDEAQDTSQEAWDCVKALSHMSKIVCLADLDQQIFDHLQSVNPERIAEIRSALCPKELNLGTENNRSPTTEIMRFANDLLSNSGTGPYKGVSCLGFHFKSPYDEKFIRKAIAILNFQIKKDKGSWPDSIAILLPAGASAAKLSRAMNGFQRPIRHKLLFDEAEAMLSARFAAYLLEPKSQFSIQEQLYVAIELLHQLKKGKGLSEARTYEGWLRKIKTNKIPKAKTVTECTLVLQWLSGYQFTGDPAQDWKAIRRRLSESNDPTICETGRNLDLVIAFNRGRLIASYLQQAWQSTGEYRDARQLLERAISQDQLIDFHDDKARIQVMTIHKAKGKQFDGVIIFGEARHNGKSLTSSFVWRNDTPPYTRSRKILRVGVTRARYRTMILRPTWPDCPILSVHNI